jgi:hypothetical protein
MKFNATARLVLAFLAIIASAKAQTTPPQTNANPNPPPAVRTGRGVDVPDPNAPATKYDYHEVWKPFFFTKNGNEYRASDGSPGPKYWQNRADYQLAAKLNDETNEITGTEVLTYTNNSPEKLGFISIRFKGE